MSQWKWKQHISSEIFGMKYKSHRKNIEQVFDDVATVVSSAETDETMKELAKEKFYQMMLEEKFIPAGRILANAWPNSPIQNYMNCFTIGLNDSMEEIYNSLKEDAMISKVGGGVGFDLSNLRPKNSELSVGGVASGPISFAKVFDASAKVIMTGGARRAAHIALLDVSHPDIEEFITVKQGDKNKALTQFNISVKVTDAFIEAVENDADWDLVFEGKVYKTVKAKALYDLIADNAFAHNEPGIFNVDRVNQYNNGFWAFEIHEVNPCGEICMPKYSICCLSALNLGSFVKNKFQDDAYFDYKEFAETITWGIRFLDNILSVAEYPLKKIENNALGWRRIGLGFTALGNVFQYMKTAYGSEKSKEIAEQIASTLRNESYKASALLAKEKGKFTFYDEQLNDAEFIKQLPEDLRDLIRENGLRNIAMNTIAPTGTTALSVGQNCSSGIEPTFSLAYTRNYRIGKDDETVSEIVYDRAWLEYLERHDAEIATKLVNGEEVKFEKPEWFSTAAEVNTYDSIDIQAIFQKYVDHSISKTLNLPPGTTREEYDNLFMYAYKKGLKGFTTFNPEGCGSPETEVLTTEGIKTFGEIFENEGIDIYNTENKGWINLKKDLEFYDINGNSCKINKAFIKGLTSNMLNITLEDGKTFCVSPEHKFMVGGDWIEAKDLQEGDDLDVYQGEFNKNKEI